MKILFLGDVASTPGREALAKHLPTLKAQHSPAITIVNGENAAANGRGLTAADAQAIFTAGADIITLGDHTFDQKGTEELLAANPRLIRPANYPAGTIGRGATTFTVQHGPHAGKKVTVINLMGRVFMRPLVDCPFRTADALLKEHVLGQTADAIFVDFHAEVTAEKTIFGHYLDGRVSAVVGTHTHCPTNDYHIRPGGSAYQTDAGMCGNYASSLGVTYESVLPTFLTGTPSRFEQSRGEATLCGTLITLGENGLATAIEPIKTGGILGA
ncbi:MAG: metallophosphoesterase [Proteobacteria bacterium]|nr:metallophosphoesterase [Pseudomonadota bacterium]